jgi:hypothetical protein
MNTANLTARMVSAARISSRHARVQSVRSQGFELFSQKAYAWQRAVGRVYRVMYRGYP